jgi:hypothetical protein
VLLDKCYPVFVQHEEQSREAFNNSLNAEMVEHPSRPQAVYSDKIINPSMGNPAMPSSMSSLPNNIGCGKQIPGVSYTPSMIANFFVLHD